MPLFPFHTIPNTGYCQRPLHSIQCSFFKLAGLRCHQIHRFSHFAVSFAAIQYLLYMPLFPTLSIQTCVSATTVPSIPFCPFFFFNFFFSFPILIISLRFITLFRLHVLRSRLLRFGALFSARNFSTNYRSRISFMSAFFLYLFYCLNLCFRKVSCSIFSSLTFAWIFFYSFFLVL